MAIGTRKSLSVIRRASDSFGTNAGLLFGESTLQKRRYAHSAGLGFSSVTGFRAVKVKGRNATHLKLHRHDLPILGALQSRNAIYLDRGPQIGRTDPLRGSFLSTSEGGCLPGAP